MTMDLPAVKHGCGNLLIMGCPGAGKSTVGAIVAKMLGVPLVDFDHDVLENVWGMKVSEKLIQLGSDRFLEAEAAEFLKYSTENSLISLTGSNPMHDEFWNHAQMLGLVFFLDVHHDDILRYLGKKTVDAAGAIVGKHDGMTWSEIVNYRQQFYVRNYHARIICERRETPTSIARKVVERWKTLNTDSSYVSTRNSTTAAKKSFLDVVIQGLATDGGLYIPKRQIPCFSLGQWGRLVELSYQERAARILEAWIDPEDIHPSRLQAMIEIAYKNFQHKDIAPVKKLKDNMYLLELFHGPTASFKDLALQLMPRFFEEAVSRLAKNQPTKKARYLILVATSGDTGSAVLEGFKNCQNVSVMVLYPENGTSAVQKRQMTSMLGESIKVVGVQGDFDFCQTAIKSIFNDEDFKQQIWTKYGYKLTAANSINWARLLPQVVYHASGYLDLVKRGEVAMGDQVDLCVPTGNFGNILAAFYAKEMGIPFHSLICASNVNKILTDFFATGTYNLQSRKLIKSISPSIDILKSSNLERFLYHITNDSGLVKDLFEQLATEKAFKIPEELRQNIARHIVGGWANEEECKLAIRSCFEDSHYLPDPHTAVGLHVGCLKRSGTARKVLVAATAHHSKFAKDVLQALGQKTNSDSPMELFKRLENVKSEPRMNNFLTQAMKNPEIHRDVCTRDRNAIKQSIEDFLAQRAGSNGR